MKTFRITVIICAVLFLFFKHENSLSGDSKSKKYFEKTFPAGLTKNKFQPGDLVLRSGKGFISDVFRQFSFKDKQFSHAGIITIEGSKVFVYHILGGERNHSSEMRKELLDSFCSAKENNSFAIYRYDLSNESKKNMLNNLQSLSEKKIVFDSHFDLATDSAMYCTELVYKVVEDAAGNPHYLPCTIINGNKYIAPDNLYMNSHAQFIYAYKY